jgi:hypothetical protein
MRGFLGIVAAFLAVTGVLYAQNVHEGPQQPAPLAAEALQNPGFLDDEINPLGTGPTSVCATTTPLNELTCTTNVDCDDGQFCNGAEICEIGTCMAGIDPCGGLFCDEVTDFCGEICSSTAACCAKGAGCITDSDCCSNKCRGKIGARRCK